MFATSSLLFPSARTGAFSPVAVDPFLSPLPAPVPEPPASALWQLEAGQPLFRAGQAHALWRVVSGVVRLDQSHPDSPVLVMLTLPGDLLGFEALAGGCCPFDASALTDVVLQPLVPVNPAQRQAWLVEAVLQQPQRSHDMARVRTGSVTDRVGELLRLLGHTPQPLFASDRGVDGDAVRQSLPPLRVLAEVVDAKPETVCRALARLLPPRTRKSGPKRWHETATQTAASAVERLTGVALPGVMA